MNDLVGSTFSGMLLITKEKRLFRTGHAGRHHETTEYTEKSLILKSMPEIKIQDLKKERQ